MDIEALIENDERVRNVTFSSDWESISIQVELGIIPIDLDGEGLKKIQSVLDQFIGMQLEAVSKYGDKISFYGKHDKNEITAVYDVDDFLHALETGQDSREYVDTFVPYTKMDLVTPVLRNPLLNPNLNRQECLPALLCFPLRLPKQ